MPSDQPDPAAPHPALLTGSPTYQSRPHPQTVDNGEVWTAYPSESSDPDAVPGLAPRDDADGEPSLTLDVDGEVFALRSDTRGGTHYDWVSGPNPGYGFTMSPTADLPLDAHVENIRGFLAQIDAATGYIADD